MWIALGLAVAGCVSTATQWTGPQPAPAPAPGGGSYGGDTYGGVIYGGASYGGDGYGGASYGGDGYGGYSYGGYSYGGDGYGGSSSLVADGGACQTGSDCASGTCEGGCGGAGTCMSRMRACTTDLVEMCSCSGQTIRGSSSCPGTRIASRGACKVSSTPTPSDADLTACDAQISCGVIFVGNGCMPSDPRAVAAGQEAAARGRWSKGRPEACGIGGRDYEERVRAIQARWGAQCVSNTCQLVDRGVQPTRP